VAGVAAIAFNWFAPRESPSVRPAFSFGHRFFAFLLWSWVGAMLIYGCLAKAWSLSHSVYDRFWLAPVAEWISRPNERIDIGAVAGAMLGAVTLLTCYSLMRARLFGVRQGWPTSGDPGTGSPQVSSWCGALSLLMAFAGFLFVCGYIFITYNPIRAHPPSLWDRAVPFTWGVIHGFGVVAAIMANRRQERWWGLAVLGLILNGLLLFVLALLEI
jgi:hypothetical protein